MATLILTALLCAIIGVHIIAASPSFGEIAANTAQSKWDAMVELLPNLDNDSLPTNSSALVPLRDSLIYLRDVLDIFPFCYPTPKKKHDEDVWEELRKDLNGGWTGIGDYLDLRHVNYTTAVQQQMLDDLLQWKAALQEHAVEYDYETYFNTPDNETFYSRPNSDLSIMFWGNSTYSPDPSKSGDYNLAILSAAQVQHGLQRFYVLTGFHNLTTVDNANYMHDYKKQLRALSRVVKWFPQIINTQDSFYTNLTTEVTACHSMLGTTHSYVVPFLYYAAHGPADMLTMSEVQLDIAFDHMKRWLAKRAWPDWLKLWEALLIFPS